LWAWGFGPRRARVLLRQGVIDPYDGGPTEGHRSRGEPSVWITGRRSPDWFRPENLLGKDFKISIGRIAELM